MQLCSSELIEEKSWARVSDEWMANHLLTKYIIQNFKGQQRTLPPLMS